MRDIRHGDLELIHGSADFLGVNSYHGELVSTLASEVPLQQDAPTSRRVDSSWPGAEHVRFHPTGAPTTSMGWEV